MVSALYDATIVFLMASHSLARGERHESAQKRKWKSRVRRAERCYLKANAGTACLSVAVRYRDEAPVAAR